MSRSLVLAALVAGASAHATHYPDAKANPMTPFSYHIHASWITKDKASATNALAFVAALNTEFNVTQHCDTVYHNPTPCYFTPDLVPAGPFQSPQTATFFPVATDEDYATFAKAFVWATHHAFAQKVQLLVHPNSGSELEDHRDYPVTLGLPQTLRLCIFEERGCDGN
jgi:hypothetical protein